jgi:hypothetical protein
MRTNLGRLQQLAQLFAELAVDGNDVELEGALDLCVDFADRIMQDRNDDETFLVLPPDSERTENKPLRRLH